MSIELQARIAAAAAVVADFRTTTLDLPGVPDWHLWALRLAQVLSDVLEQLETDPEAGQLAQIRLVLDAFDWGGDDLQYALEQVDYILRGDR